MEKYEEEIKKAEEEIKMADHLIYVTSPVVKDKNLLLSAFDHIYEAFKRAVNGYLLYKRNKKEIFSLPRGEKQKVNVFLKKFGNELGIGNEEQRNYLKFERTGRKKEKGKYSLLKKNSLHFVLEEYRTTSIKVDQIKDNLLMIKSLINKINEKCQLKQ